MTSNNMYRVGDFVYFEVAASAPYQIRKIEELNKTSTGAVEAKVVCFYRRRDLSLNLIELADKHQEKLSLSSDISQRDSLRQIRHRELFLSRQLETLPATHIRGKCTVTLHNDTEPCSIYLSKEDAFFFQFVYDPLQKTLQADRGTIREGPDYQADVPSFDLAKQSSCYDNVEPLEELQWNPNSGLSSCEIDSYLLLARSLGTLGRAYYPATSLRQPNLSMSAACAARDVTSQLAMDTLHSANYDVVEALRRLCPNGQPVVKLDEMESWSVSEGNLFEEALEKYGKCFYDIQSDFLPWKHPKTLIEFYYMWKTTDHYIQQKRIKAAEAEHHLKQVYIPNYNKPNPAVLYPGPESPHATCEACPNASSPQWYALGPSNSPLRVCADCWTYWKRYGDLKAASILAGPLRSTNGRIPGILRDGIGFHFLATPLLRILRRLHPRGNSTPRQQARRPFRPGSSIPCWQANARSRASNLRASTIQRFTERLRDLCSSHHTPAEKRVRFHKFLCQIFPSFAFVKTNELNGIVGSEQESETSKNLPDPQPTANGPAATAPSLDRKRPVPTSEPGLNPPNASSNSCSSKRFHLSNETPVLDETNFLQFAGPRRRTGIGPGEGGPNTLMFLATDSTKRFRRKHQTIVELRRLGRRPCLAAFQLSVESEQSQQLKQPPNTPYQASTQPDSTANAVYLKQGTMTTMDKSPAHPNSHFVSP